MAAIATITHPDGSKALVFYNTAEKTIGLQIRDGVLATDDDSNELSTDSVTSTYQDSDTTVTGLVNNPTSLACLYLNASDTKLVRCYLSMRIAAKPTQGWRIRNHQGEHLQNMYLSGKLQRSACLYR